MLPLAPLPVPSSLAPPRPQGNPVALLAVGLLALATACAGSEPPVEDSSAVPFTASAELNELRGRSEGPQRKGIITNGIITNGIITNGIITNGLSLKGTLSNGLATHGLGSRGLANPAFAAWFNAYPEDDADMAMHYVVACAVPSKEQRTWRNPETGARFTWTGGLGLAPGWADGRPVSEDEQQLVSACLAAMVNKYGVHVPVSVRGRDARGRELASGPGEEAFTVREAAFFGNLFTEEGLFVCSDRFVLDPAESSARACGLFSREFGLSQECPPLVHAGLCPRVCEKKRGSGNDYYESCTVGRKEYLTVTTRLREEDVYRCGDGVCQVSESCDDSRVGVGRTADSCFADCGRCAKQRR